MELVWLQYLSWGLGVPSPPHDLDSHQSHTITGAQGEERSVASFKTQADVCT